MMDNSPEAWALTIATLPSIWIPNTTEVSELQYPTKGAALSMNFSFRRAWMMASFLTNRPGAMRNIFIPSEGISGYWQKPGDIAKISTPHYSANLFHLQFDGGYMDISYLQMNNISLSYSLNNDLVRKAGMKTCALALTLSNIFTITQYPRIDPVVGLGLPSQKTDQWKYLLHLLKTLLCCCTKKIFIYRISHYSNHIAVGFLQKNGSRYHLPKTPLLQNRCSRMRPRLKEPCRDCIP